MSPSSDTELLAAADAAAARAYAPYSRFHVGCVVLARDGRVIEGVNVENAAYPLGICAEKAALSRAVAGYKEINLRAIKLLSPGGVLITCTCSHHVQEPMFLDILSAAAADAHATLMLLEKRLQARDHPVLIGVPETAYLKCLVLRRVA